MEGGRETASRPTGVVAVERLRQMAGLDFLRAIVAGELPGPPICAVLPFALVLVEPGRAVFAGEPDARLYNPLGTVHGGFTMTLLDSCMGCAVQSVLAAGRAFTTVETKVNFVRPITAETGRLTAEGRVVHSGSRIASAEGRLVDAAGKLYAHGTSTCLVLTL